MTVRVRPDPVYVERSGEHQLLSFDFELLNSGAAPLDVENILMKAYDKTGRLLAWEKLDSNGSLDADGLPAVFQGYRRIGSPAAETGRIAPGWIVIMEPVR